MKVEYLRVQVRRAACEACSGNFEVSGTIPAFALIPRETCVEMAGLGTFRMLPSRQSSGIQTKESSIRESKRNINEEQLHIYILQGKFLDVSSKRE